MTHAQPVNDYFGKLGERVHVQCSVVFAKCMPNEWGLTFLVKLRDDAGHSFSTFYSGRKWLPMINQRVDITATVKAHAPFMNTRETELTRAKVKDLGHAPGRPALKHVAPSPIRRATPWVNSSFNKPEHCNADRRYP